MSDTESVLEDDAPINMEPLGAVRTDDQDLVEKVVRGLLSLFRDQTGATDWGVTPLHVNNSDDMDYMVTAHYRKTTITLRELQRLKDLQPIRVQCISVDYVDREGEPHLKVDVLVLGYGSAVHSSLGQHSNPKKRRMQ